MLSVEIAKVWLCSKTVDLDFTAPACGTKLQGSMEGLRRTQPSFRVVFDDMGAGRVAGNLAVRRAAGKIGELDLDPGRLQPMVGEARAWSEQFFQNSPVAVHDRHAVRSEAGASVPNGACDDHSSMRPIATAVRPSKSTREIARGSS